ncbi:MAG TPA: hypothetical protein VE360_02145, partial [Pyrinomonadaceae bacterium]|nr:hypothetical protein [Pyrinomonadaceae bacterium]
MFVVVLVLLATAGPFDLKAALRSSLELGAAAAHRGGAEVAEGTRRAESVQPAARPTPAATPVAADVPDDEVER